MKVGKCAGTAAAVCESNKILRGDKELDIPALPGAIPGAVGNDLGQAVGRDAAKSGPAQEGEVYFDPVEGKDVQSMYYFINRNIRASRNHAPSLCDPELREGGKGCCKKVKIIPETMSGAFPVFKTETLDCRTGKWNNQNELKRVRVNEAWVE